MADRRTFVVVGASLCGATAVATLRSEGFDGRIVLVGAEEHPPYERPPLSKEYLRGEDPPEKILVRPEAWYEDHDVETRFGTLVTQLDAHDRSVVLAGGERRRVRCAPRGHGRAQPADRTCPGSRARRRLRSPRR